MALNIYQLKIQLNRIRPPVWRRVLVSGDSTISSLHEIVQAAMGWYNCHLHQFLIRGREYGVSYAGGVHFADDPDKIRLSDFHFQPQDRFEYLYDFGDNWEHDITVEKILPLDTARTYPVCIGGRGECPPEDSGGPWMYRARRQGKRRTKADGEEEDRFDPEAVNHLLRDLHTRWFKRATNIE
jgi:Plasmid pRiA4b ORF-3-like protein